MRTACVAAIVWLAALPALAQAVEPAGDYRTCSAEMSEQGRGVVAEACGTLAVPDFTGVEFQSLEELQAGEAMRDSFVMDVGIYGRCVSEVITSRLQHEGPEDGFDADKAACAHSWAEEEATEVVRSFGRACVAYADRSIIDMRIRPYDGPCYPAVKDGEG